MAVVGCSEDAIKRAGYGIGDHFTCTQQNTNHPNESVEDLDCGTINRDMSYEEYEQARRDNAEQSQ